MFVDLIGVLEAVVISVIAMVVFGDEATTVLLVLVEDS